jgi:hypothetical protein
MARQYNSRHGKTPFASFHCFPTNEQVEAGLRSSGEAGSRYPAERRVGALVWHKRCLSSSGLSVGTGQVACTQFNSCLGLEFNCKVF